MARTGRPPTPAPDRFQRYASERASGCIEWTGFIDRDGYGQFRPGGRDSNKMGAHRWSYEHYVGSVPEGMQIDHLCRNRACVNPEHLEAVSPSENVMRGNGPGAINASKSHCDKGHPLSDGNIYVYGNRRVCKECKRIQSAVNYRNRKAS